MALHYQTVTPLLKEVLEALMAEPLFAPFRLVGGTNLSLRYGHRISVDIDLFTDAEYRSLDFGQYEDWLKSTFAFYECPDKSGIVSFGRGYYVGNSKDDSVKLDLMYTDPYISEIETIDGIRMAGVDDIVAMKMNVIANGGRKKDFWDVHHLLNYFKPEQMFALHKRRYEWEHDEALLQNNFINFSRADKDQSPVCLLNKDWAEIKLDIMEVANGFQNKD